MTTATPGPRTWQIDLTYDKPPLSLNDRRHHMTVWRIRRDLVNEVRTLVRAQRIPRLAGVHVELHYVPARLRIRDADNAVATLKPCIDGLRDYPAQYRKGVLKQPAWTGIVPDDNADFVTWEPPFIHRPDATHSGPRLWLILREIP